MIIDNEKQIYSYSIFKIIISPQAKCFLWTDFLMVPFSHLDWRSSLSPREIRLVKFTGKKTAIIPESSISSFSATINQIVYIRGSFYTKKRMDYDCFPQLFYNQNIRKTYSKTLFNALPSNVCDNFLVKSFSTTKIWFTFEENNEKIKRFSQIILSH